MPRVQVRGASLCKRTATVPPATSQKGLAGHQLGGRCPCNAPRRNRNAFVPSLEIARCTLEAGGSHAVRRKNGQTQGGRVRTVSITSFVDTRGPVAWRNERNERRAC